MLPTFPPRFTFFACFHRSVDIFNVEPYGPVQVKNAFFVICNVICNKSRWLADTHFSQRNTIFFLMDLAALSAKSVACKATTSILQKHQKLTQNETANRNEDCCINYFDPIIHCKSNYPFVQRLLQHDSPLASDRVLVLLLTV